MIAFIEGNKYTRKAFLLTDAKGLGFLLTIHSGTVLLEANSIDIVQ